MQDFGHCGSREMVGDRRDSSCQVNIRWNRPPPEASEENAVGPRCGNELPDPVWH
jgi:hypothetical protein